MISLRDWSPGNSVFSNSHHQQAVDGLRELQAEVSSVGARLGALTHTVWRPGQRQVAKIVDAGPEDEADWTDARYWVQLQLTEGTPFQEKITGFIEDTMASAHLESDDDAVPSILTATNLPEWTEDGGSHGLAVGDYVTVEAWWDTGTVAEGEAPEAAVFRLQYFIDRLPVSGAARVQVSAEVSTGVYDGYRYNADGSLQDELTRFKAQRVHTVGADTLIVKPAGGSTGGGVYEWEEVLELPAGGEQYMLLQRSTFGGPTVWDVVRARED